MPSARRSSLRRVQSDCRYITSSEPLKRLTAEREGSMGGGGVGVMERLSADGSCHKSKWKCAFMHSVGKPSSGRVRLAPLFQPHRTSARLQSSEFIVSPSVCCPSQLRLGERLLDDSAPQGTWATRQRPSWDKRECAFASSRARRPGAGGERHQPSLPHPETGTASLA